MSIQLVNIQYYHVINYVRGDIPSLIDSQHSVN